MKRLSLLALTTLPLATACGPGPLEQFDAVSFGVVVDDNTAAVTVEFFRDDGCTGDADALAATINDGEAVVTLVDNYGGGGGGVPSPFSQGCIMVVRRTFDVTGVGTAADVVVAISDGETELAATSPASVRAFGLTPAVIEDPIQFASTFTFTVDPPLAPDLRPFVLIGDQGTTSTFDGTSLDVSVLRSEPGPTTFDITLEAGPVVCVFDGGECGTGISEFRATRTLTIAN